MKKRILSIALAIVMVMALAVSASAVEFAPSAENNGTPDLEGDTLVTGAVSEEDKTAVEDLDITEALGLFPAGTSAGDLAIVSMFDVSLADGTTTDEVVTFTMDATNLPDPCAVFHLMHNGEWELCDTTRTATTLTVTCHGLSAFVIVGDMGNTGNPGGTPVPTGYDFTPAVVIVVVAAAFGMAYGFKRAI